MTEKNVLILHTDQQRYDSMGCTGNATAETPNLDRLAAEGTQFTRQVAANTICMPSRASFFTGLYPPGHGVWDNGVPLGRSEYVDFNPTRHGAETVVQRETMADLFAREGYRTASFGKLHLTSFLAPESHGFHESESVWKARPEEMESWHGPYYGFQEVELTCGHGPSPTGHFREWLKREHPDVMRRLQESAKHKPIPEINDLYVADMPLELHPTSWLADRFTSWLETNREREAPFFAFVGFPDPHHPFVPTAEAMERFQDRPVAGPYDPEGNDWRDYVSGKMASGNSPSLSTDDRERVIRVTNAMIWQIDRAVGRILEALDRHGLSESTIVVFTSDHGDFMWDHGLLRKGVGASHQLLHVPLIVRDPGRAGGQAIDRVTSNCDVLPTLAGLCGIEPRESVHGRDLFAGQDGDACAFAYCSIGTAESTNLTVFDDRYRYTVYPQTGRRELFDHQEDPWESRNLLAGHSHPRANALHRELERAMPRHYLPGNGRMSAW